MKYNYKEMEADIKTINEMRYIQQQTRLQDEQQAKELGMTLAEYYKERDAMRDDEYALDTNLY